VRLTTPVRGERDEASREGAAVVDGTIPSNVKWRSAQGRTTIFYTVEYARPNGHRVEVGTGSCLKEDVAQCGLAIVRKAEKIVSEEQ
jgi:hypothetical protein